MSNQLAIDRGRSTNADLVIGAGAHPRRAGPEAHHAARCCRRMKPGAALVDVAIDQGGCFETSHPTTHSDPVYVVDGIVHYCVANMPGAVADHLHRGGSRT